MQWPDGGDVVIYDLEVTAWPGSATHGWNRPGEYREIIQVGAVRCDAARFVPRQRFEVLCRPRRNPVLSDYIQALTGLSNDRLRAAGLEFEQAMDDFLAFCDGAAWILSFGGDETVLAENYALHDLPAPDLGRFLDIKPTLCRTAGLPLEIRSSDLPARLGLALDLPPHHAVADALAVCAALQVLRARG
ncbi:MAG: hypothetical protein K2Q10_11620 [Rhodospirillales bacterium]|nr:hypothetical protein [Rhodospirillales bacterium]